MSRGTEVDSMPLRHTPAGGKPRELNRRTQSSTRPPAALWEAGALLNRNLELKYNFTLLGCIWAPPNRTYLAHCSPTPVFSHLIQRTFPRPPSGRQISVCIYEITCLLISKIFAKFTLKTSYLFGNFHFYVMFETSCTNRVFLRVCSPNTCNTQSRTRLSEWISYISCKDPVFLSHCLLWSRVYTSRS